LDNFSLHFRLFTSLLTFTLLDFASLHFSIISSTLYFLLIQLNYHFPYPLFKSDWFNTSTGNLFQSAGNWFQNLAVVQCYSKRTLLRWFDEAVSNKTYLGLHVNTTFISPILTKFGFYREIFVEVSNIRRHENLSSGSGSGTSGKIDGRTWRS